MKENSFFLCIFVINNFFEEWLQEKNTKSFLSHLNSSRL